MVLVQNECLLIFVGTVFGRLVCLHIAWILLNLPKKCGIPISIFWMHLEDIIGCYCGFVEIQRRNTVFDVTSQPSSFRLFPIDLWFSPFSIGPWTNMRFIFWKNLLFLILPPHGTTVDWHSRYLHGCCRRYSYNCVVLFHLQIRQ
jgi:hypothetical protein